MPDGMDGTRREALREALRRRECERGGGGPDFETVRRRVAAAAFGRHADPVCIDGQ